MTVFDNISTLLLLTGIGIIVYNLIETHKLMRLLQGSKSYIWWQYIFYFTIFFLIGYIVTLILIIWGMATPILMLTGVIFFFGAVFMTFVVKLGWHTFDNVMQTTISQEHLELIVQQRNNELQQATHTLEILNQTKTDFINVMAHELRTPLTVIRGYNQLMTSMEPVKNNPDIKVMCSGMLIGVDRMYDIINQLLDITRIEADVMSLGQGKLTVSYAIERVCSRVEDQIEQRHLTLHIDDLSDLPSISADPKMIHKLFLHLLMNAIKYTPDGGQIHIYGKRMIDDMGKTAVEINIRDTGIGIAKQHQKVIFEKFYCTGELSLHSSGRVKFKGGGAGLGLAIAQGIAQAHGGHIWVESVGYDEEKLPGSTFHVLLPAVNETNGK